MINLDKWQLHAQLPGFTTQREIRAVQLFSLFENFRCVKDVLQANKTEKPQNEEKLGFMFNFFILVFIRNGNLSFKYMTFSQKSTKF